MPEKMESTLGACGTFSAFRPTVCKRSVVRRNPIVAAKLLIAIAVISAFASSGQTPQRPGSLQPLAITFDDLPTHGSHLPAISSLQVVQSILATLQREKLPLTYGFINGVKTEESPETFEVLRAW
jgi:peptidoglycan/xylan/chitin deacetylase (PgdA/CDA1 family)